MRAWLRAAHGHGRLSEEQVRWSSLECAGARGSALERAGARLSVLEYPLRGAAPHNAKNGGVKKTVMHAKMNKVSSKIAKTEKSTHDSLQNPLQNSPHYSPHYSLQYSCNPPLGVRGQTETGGEAISTHKRRYPREQRHPQPTRNYISWVWLHDA